MSKKVKNNKKQVFLLATLLIFTAALVSLAYMNSNSSKCSMGKLFQKQNYYRGNNFINTDSTVLIQISNNEIFDLSACKKVYSSENTILSTDYYNGKFWILEGDTTTIRLKSFSNNFRRTSEKNFDISGIVPILDENSDSLAIQENKLIINRTDSIDINEETQAQIDIMGELIRTNNSGEADAWNERHKMRDGYYVGDGSCYSEETLPSASLIKITDCKGIQKRAVKIPTRVNGIPLNSITDIDMTGFTAYYTMLDSDNKQVQKIVRYDNDGKELQTFETKNGLILDTIFHNGILHYLYLEDNELYVEFIK